MSGLRAFVAVSAIVTVALEARPCHAENALSGDFQWRLGEPVVELQSPSDDVYYSVKDPTIVRYGERWHLFSTIRGEKRSHQIVYLGFDDWKNARGAKWHVLRMHDGFFCAPQVFYFRPQKQWYLICQASDESWEPKYAAAYATTTDLSDPASWSPLRPLGHRQADGKSGLDFWIICDDEKAHLFFTTLDGRMWREETALGSFPKGWSEPALALEADIFEASHIYRLKGAARHGAARYLGVIEAQNGHGWRYFKAYVADRLDGEWTPLAATKDQAFASMRNTRFDAARWTDSISHGELLRAGYDERLEVDPAALRFVFQGVRDDERKGKPYGQIPWRLGLLEPAGADR